VTTLAADPTGRFVYVLELGNPQCWPLRSARTSASLSTHSVVFSTQRIDPGINAGPKVRWISRLLILRYDWQRPRNVLCSLRVYKIAV
jgi:hypothetical protein